MRLKITSSTSATVTLTAREARLYRAGRVPYIYSPGGMGLREMPPITGGTVDFGGACYVDVEQKLRDSFAAFDAAMQAAIQAETERDEAAEAEAAGFSAFPSGGYMDAMRGAKGFPQHVRCPFKLPHRVAAWTRGYDAAADALA